MSDTKKLTIHFVDGTQKKFEFDIENIDYFSLSDFTEKTINGSMLILETKDTLHAFPYSNIKHFEICPCPEVLPDITVRGVRPIG